MTLDDGKKFRPFRHRYLSRHGVFVLYELSDEYLKKSKSDFWSAKKVDFFIISTGSLAEFAFCCGRMMVPLGYARRLVKRIEDALADDPSHLVTREYDYYEQ